LMHQDTWNKISNDIKIHDGAFGQDVKTVRTKDSRIMKLVWKFPFDLKYLPMYNRTRTWLPVGTYNIYEDSYTTRDFTLERTFTPPLIVQSMTKWRYDTDDGVDVHVLENSGRTHTLAMISSTYFYQQFFGAQDKDDIRRVNQLIKNLREIGIVAYSCHGEQHAIIFYGKLNSVTDAESKKPLPTLSHKAFQKSMEGGENKSYRHDFKVALKVALHRRSSESCDSNIDKWYNNMCINYCRAIHPN